MKPATMQLIHLEGLVPYATGLDLQRTCLRERNEGLRPDTLILLEHEPVITLGRNAEADGVVVSSEYLKSRGISVHRIERGGQATYHGPGQIVGYPILKLKDLGLGIRTYIERLEEVMIRTAGALSVTAYRVEGKPGIFCDQGKIGAVGVAVSRGVTLHGFAFNACPTLSNYQLIVPCGLSDTPVTSIESVTGSSVSVSQVQWLILEAWDEIFGTRFTSNRDSSLQKNKS